MKVTPHNMKWIRDEEVQEVLDVLVRVDKTDPMEKLHIVFKDIWNEANWYGEYIRTEKDGKVFRLTCKEHSGTGYCKKFKKKIDGIEGRWTWFEKSMMINEKWIIQET